MPRPVRSLSYNRLEGYIACGGDEGVLKAVRLDSKNGSFNLHIFVGSNYVISHFDNCLSG